ncbi:cupin domain-containing protein [Hymenobacter sp. GOD-10R]|uniref:cupin domain-containing protein n=1 Tax=Hymenobacter sp. GOD-10R TaxID=3093922 RepID=UPI002D79B077|nr:cupin domain-containing protein [Hymenobacter sp. GOD-10R]WRQ27616.1 cupin domain-containing protein [Hymenobacter sp. GOD-10R]
MAYTGQVIENPVTGQRIRFVALAEASAGAELVLESTFRGRGLEPPAHFHPEQDEFFEVLQGELQVRLDGKLRVLHQGTTLRINRGQVHSMWNVAEQPAVVRWAVRPALNTETFMEELFAASQNERGMPTPQQVGQLLHQFGREFRLAPPPAVAAPV